MKKDDLLYFLHIRDCINKIIQYTAGIDRSVFDKDTMIQDATVRQLEIIGEASSKINKQTREKYKDIAWKEMIGMRNKIIHEYFGIRLGIVWDTICNDIPVLKKQIEKIIEDLTPQSTLDF